MRELRSSLVTIAMMVASILHLRSYPFQRRRGIENWVYAAAAAAVLIVAGLAAYYLLVISGATSTTTTYH